MSQYMPISGFDFEAGMGSTACRNLRSGSKRRRLGLSMQPYALDWNGVSISS